MSEETKFKKSLALNTLTVQVAAHEQGTGALIDLDRTSTHTIGIYEPGPSPEHPVKLVEKIDGHAVIPSGYEKVCDGKVWIVNQKRDVVAIRKSI
jgi:hypothetical protein